jgi:hypothetical protein
VVGQGDSHDRSMTTETTRARICRVPPSRMSQITWRTG